MKKLISLLVIIICAMSLSFGQSYKMKATSFSYKVGDQAWTKATDSAVIITLNIDAKQLVIYSKDTQTYDLIRSTDTIKDKDGDDIITYVVVDNKGIECNIHWIKLNSQGGRLQLYIEYSNVSWLYNIYLV